MRKKRAKVLGSLRTNTGGLFPLSFQLTHIQEVFLGNNLFTNTFTDTTISTQYTPCTFPYNPQYIGSVRCR